jgi:hypothetical protein
MVQMFSARTGTSTAAPLPGRRPRLALRLPAGLVGLVAVALPLVQACSFEAPEALKTPKSLYAVLNQAPFADPETITGDRYRVIDSPRLKVDHGYTCAPR